MGLGSRVFDSGSGGGGGVGDVSQGIVHEPECKEAEEQTTHP